MIGRKWTGRTGALSTTFFAGEIFEVGFFEKSSACVKSSAVRFAVGETIKYYPIPLYGRRAARPPLSPPGALAGPLCTVGPSYVPTTGQVWYEDAGRLSRSWCIFYRWRRCCMVCGRCGGPYPVYGQQIGKPDTFKGWPPGLLSSTTGEQIDGGSARPAGWGLFASTTKADRHGAGLVPDGKSI